MKKPPEPDENLPPMREIPRLADVLPQLIAMRGIGRIRGDRQLLDAWRAICPEEIGRGSRPTTLRNGTLTILVHNSTLLSELVSFHKSELLAKLKSQHPQLRVRDLKFRLQTRDSEKNHED